MRLSLPVCLGFCLAGCGEPLLHAQVDDLRHRLDEAQRRSASAEKKAEELEDRVFLLTDRVESAKVAQSRRAAPAPSARLPVVTLHPEDAGPADDSDVEYRGEARISQPAADRPFLHAVGTPSPSKEPVAGREAAVVTKDNLGVAPAPFPTGADPIKLYKTAYEELRAGRHDDAVRDFRAFIQKFPRHDYADNAQYWLGECFYDRKRFAEAAVEFRATVATYPTGNKAPDAMLKLSYCALALGDGKKGRELLAQLPETYPRTEAARLAADRLAELGLKGGTQ